MEIAVGGSENSQLYNQLNDYEGFARLELLSKVNSESLINLFRPVLEDHHLTTCTPILHFGETAHDHGQYQFSRETAAVSIRRLPRVH
jgi:hypothetical protein